MSKGTISVDLKKDWFAPDGSLYQARDNPHEFPESWKDQFPTTVKVLDKPRESGPLPAGTKVAK